MGKEQRIKGHDVKRDKDAEKVEEEGDKRGKREQSPLQIIVQ